MLRWLLPTTQRPRLEGALITLRPMGRKDYHDWSSALTEDADLFRSVQPTWRADQLAPASFRRRLGRFARMHLAGRGFLFAIEDAQTGEFAGELELAPIHRGAFQKATLGYWLARGHRGEGKGQAAIAAAADFALGELKLARLEAFCHLQNARSISALEATGFNREGVMANFLEIEGVRRDHVLYARVA